MKLRFICILILILSISACSDKVESDANNGNFEIPINPSNNTQSTDIEGYPVIIDSYFLGEGYPINFDNSSDIKNQVPALSLELSDLDLPNPIINIPTPEPGKGSIAGVLFSVPFKKLIPETVFYLIEGTGINESEVPPIIVGPSSDQKIFKSDIHGVFTINNIIPGKYFLIMAAPPYDWTVGYRDLLPTPYLIEVKSDDSTNLGIIYIFWP